MTKSKVVSQLVLEIRRRFHGVSQMEIERRLMIEGWCIGAIREALALAYKVQHGRSYGGLRREAAPARRDKDVPGLSARASRMRLLLGAIR